MRKKALGILLAAILVFAPFGVSAAGSNEIPKGTPTLDGVVEELWNASSDVINISMHMQGDEDTNANGYARVMWDDKYLYCLGVVRDSTQTTGWKEGTSYWNTDAFEVFLDEAYVRGGDVPIAQFRVDRKGILTGMLQHTTKDEAGIKAEYTDVKWAIKDGSDGYVVEIAIPWTRISPSANVTKIGIEFQIDDEQNNSGNTDGMINSVCPNVWNCGTYRTLVLSSKAAAVSGNNAGTTSSGQSTGTGTGAGNHTSSGSSGGNTASGSNNDSSGNQSDTATTGSGTGENQDASDVQNGGSDTTNPDDAASGDVSDVQAGTQQNDPDSGNQIIMIILGAVIALCLVGIILVYLLVVRKKPTPPNKEEEQQ